VFFGGKRIARRQSSGTVHYYFADHLGSSRVVTSATGAILDDADFYPFGGERVVNSSSGNAYKFTGKERDSESSLDYFGARYYASSLGRFTSVDPSRRSIKLHDPQAWNRYSYTENRPLIQVDVNGKWSTRVHGEIIDRVFRSLSIADRAILKGASASVDKDQSVVVHTNTACMRHFNPPTWPGALETYG
jgi:RHS repeat-associated protein